MGKAFDASVVASSIPKLLAYLPVSLEITVISMVLGLLLGLAFAMIKIKKVPVLSKIVSIFVSFIRGTPLIVQLYMTYYAIPMLLKYINFQYGTSYSIHAVPDLLFVVVTFTFNEAAYHSEIIRAALLSVQRGQIEAAESLGMTGFQVFRRVILPQAAVVALPPLGNALIGLLKGTSLAFAAGVTEMTAAGKIISGSNFRFFEVYLALAVIYWGMTILIERVAAAMERRLSVPEQVPEPGARGAWVGFFSYVRGGRL